ncbi:5'-3' exonuclease H3TH domain-containing protein [Mycoplasmopsis synoviae]|nr:5'-3' exonuclease H3TH domain-containing protein [Mycoplasmopsis synoviae]QGL45459.1 DNA polymerase I [Mycoplasmopsis synoviae]QXV99330.1 DNA polymerase I [Mycoplasmopsis synoviae]ULL02281.1 DNA polymerase I [Mycoplasmopsis synoviae]
MEFIMEKALIIDGNYLMFQSFYATYRGDINVILRTSNGTPTNAITLFLKQLVKYLVFYKPDYLFIAFDAKERTKRHELLDGYKANRIKAPQELFIQFDLIKEILKEMKVFYYESTGDEADDLIATFCKNFESLEKFIFSRDKDLLQLVNKNTRVFFKDEEVTYLNFFEKYQINPDQIIDFKALKGDPSDNLPGIKGIGDKTAIKLLNEFKTFENIYQNLDSKLISEKVKNNLLKGKENGMLCYQLAKLNYEVEVLPKNLDLFKLNIDLKASEKILDELELNTTKKMLLDKRWLQ